MVDGHYYHYRFPPHRYVQSVIVCTEQPVFHGNAARQKHQKHVVSSLVLLNMQTADLYLS